MSTTAAARPGGGGGADEADVGTGEAEMTERPNDAEIAAAVRSLHRAAMEAKSCDAISYKPLLLARAALMWVIGNVEPDTDEFVFMLRQLRDIDREESERN